MKPTQIRPVKTTPAVFILTILFTAIILFLWSCGDSSAENPDTHARYFEVSDEPLYVNNSYYYITRLRTSLTDCPQDLIVPARVNGKKVEGFYSSAFGTYNINSVYVHKKIKYIPYMLLSDSSVKKITVPEKFRDSFLVPPTTGVVYY